MRDFTEVIRVTISIRLSLYPLRSWLKWIRTNPESLQSTIPIRASRQKSIRSDFTATSSTISIHPALYVHSKLNPNESEINLSYTFSPKRLSWNKMWNSNSDEKYPQFVRNRTDTIFSIRKKLLRLQSRDGVSFSQVVTNFSQLFKSVCLWEINCLWTLSQSLISIHFFLIQNSFDEDYFTNGDAKEKR